MDTPAGTVTPRIEAVEDAVRTYTPEEEAVLARQLYTLADGIHQGRFIESPIDCDLLCRLHRELFAGVRDFAGRCRSFDFGSERLTFGPHSSVHRRDVAAELEAVFHAAQISIRSLEDNDGDPEYERFAIHTALWLHAEVIRIHPFEDGSGRSGRLMMNTTLVRLGLHPIAIEAPRDEYIDCMNHYIQRRQPSALQPLLDLALRLYRAC